MSPSELNPASLSLSELRALRAELQRQEDVVSYVRRLVQARVDMVGAEQRRRSTGADPTGGLPAILSGHLIGGPARPPRPVGDFSELPLAKQLDALCSLFGATDLAGLTDDELAGFHHELVAFEHARSHERRQIFDRLDALSAELVRRYRDGEADVDSLLAD
jgi:hypothetical protein